MHKHMVVQTVKPESPEITGELSMACNLMLIKTNISVTSIPTLPGYAFGGIKKLNQLNTTIMAVGTKTWTIVRESFLFKYTKYSIIFEQVLFHNFYT